MKELSRHHVLLSSSDEPVTVGFEPTTSPTIKVLVLYQRSYTLNYFHSCVSVLLFVVLLMKKCKFF